jgi:hypothetical protein
VLFPTPEYALFFLVVFAAAWAARRALKAHKALLLGASYFFYGFWDWRFLPLLAGISLVAAVVGRRLQVERRPGVRKAFLATGVALALSALAVFKYLLPSARVQLLDLGLPHAVPSPNRAAVACLFSSTHLARTPARRSRRVGYSTAAHVVFRTRAAHPARALPAALAPPDPPRGPRAR